MAETSANPDYRQLDSLAYAGGRPQTAARLKAEFSDFQVDEDLGFEPSGSGEHLYIQVRKQDITTTQTARRLSEIAGLPLRDIGYAGMKDRRGLCRQWFSLRQPGNTDPDLSGFDNENMRIEQRARNHRKLQIGSHRSNHFRLLLRDCQGPQSEFEGRLQTLAERGMPNYFGAQRFGRELSNLTQVREYFASGSDKSGLPRGGRGRQRRGMLLSAARAYLFNQVLSARLASGQWCRYIEGDVLSLDGSGRSFTVVAGEWDETLQQRLDSFDIHISGPLPGRVTSKDRYTSQRESADMEKAVLAKFDELVDGLTRAGVDAGRRPLRSRIHELRWQWLGPDRLELAFTLPRGAYATSLLRELCITGQNSESSDERTGIEE